MSQYFAPVRDIRFTLDHIVDFPAVTALEPFAEVTPDLVDAILNEAGRFASEVMAPSNVIGDRQGCTLENGMVRTPDGYPAIYKQYVENGWNSLPFPTAIGGQGLPISLTIATNEMWAAANMGFSLAFTLNHGAVEVLEAYGTEEMKQLYLEKMVSGEWACTMNLTEPQAGSDVGALRTKAEPKDDGTYLISGQKIFITFGEHDLTDNIIHLVLARTPDSPPGTKGISLFIVPKFHVNPDGSLGPKNDLRCVSLEHKMGIHASPTCVMSYGDDGNCVGYMLGEEHGGMRAMFLMMNNARLLVGLQGVGVSERAYQHALAYAKERRQGRPIGSSSKDSRPIIEHADVRRMLMTMKAKSDAARALAYLAGTALDLSAHHPDKDMSAAQLARAELMTPIVKSWCSDAGIDVASLGVQVHGGMGFIEETGAAQYYREVRIAAIYEGTNGIQANDLLFRKLPAHGGAALKSLIDELKAAVTTRPSCAELEDMAITVEQGLDALGEVADWFRDAASHDPVAAAPGAAAFLNMAGTVIGGALLAKGAAQAKRMIDAGDESRPFLETKIALAGFFAATEIPAAVARGRAAKQSNPIVAGLAPDALQ
jgi:alkylation response protein AidB-like acyl-CoA dehydrogenase